MEKWFLASPLHNTKCTPQENSIIEYNYFKMRNTMAFAKVLSTAFKNLIKENNQNVPKAKY